MDKVYICTACGKRSIDKFGYDAIDDGWDESCYIHSELVDKEVSDKIHDSFRKEREKMANSSSPK